MSDEWSPTSVQVTVLQARGLRVKGKSGTNDAYAVMQVGKEKFQTAVVEKSVAPVWKEEATFDLPPVLQGGGGGPERCTLQVQVLHRALVGPDKLLGQAVINLLQLSEDKTRIKTEWFKLLDKTGKSDKERGEVLLDVQFLRNNMTASMFDLSAAGKSRSRLGKFKDKVRGKKKGSESPVAPSLTQVLTDSEEEEGGNEEAEGKEGKNGKSKKHKMKSLFAPKSNLQKNMSQSMSVLPVKNSSLSGSQSGLNVDSSEGKKKFKFSIHKRSGSSGNKDSASGCKSQAPAEQSNLCINGSHVYCEEPPPRTSRLGSNLSLTSSGHGSMEDAPDSSLSVESLKAVKEYSPCMEEEEEEEEEEKYQDVTEIVDEEEDRIQIKEESKVEETLRRWQELRQRDDGIKVLKEEDRDGEEKEMLRKQEELENLRLKEEREAEEERAKREEEERIRKEKMAREEEEREAEVEKAKREERIQKEMKLKEEKRRKEEEEQKRLAEEQQRLEEERIRKEMEMKQEEDERRNEEEQKRLAEQQQRLEKEEEEQKRLAEEQQRLEEEERRKEEEEQKRLAEEQQRLEEEERRNLEEERIRREEEKAVERKRWEEEFKLAEEKRLKEEEKLRREEEERRQIEELMKKQRKQEEERLEKEEMKRLEEERARKEREEHERLIEIRRKEEEKIRLEEEEKVRMEKEVEMRRLEELEKLRREEEKKREIEEMAKREEEMRREEEDRIQKEDEERLKREEEKARKKKEDIERRAEEMRKMEEQERIRREERAEKERKEEEERKLEKENKRNEAQRATEKTSKMVKAAEIPSTNPFDEDFSLPEEIPRSSPELHNLPENDDPLQQRCQLAASSARSVAISADEKDLINTQREKRPAPQPPGRNLPERLRQSEEEEEDECTRHLSQINKQSKEKDVKTVSVPPQRSVQKIAPLNRSPKDSNTQSEAQNSSTKQGKRPAPSRPPPVEDEPPSVGKTSHRVVTETQQVRTVHSLNPFEDDDDEEDTAVCWSPASQTDVSQAKLKSSKVIRAPPPPNEAPSNILIHQNDVTDETSDPLSEVKRPNKESEKNKVVAGVKEEGPPVNPRRLQTVKPLNPLEQQPASVVQQEKNKSTGSDYSGDQNNTKVDAVITGPYSQLTREELISLVLKQEKQLTEKDKKISELERYIDNLLVRVIEEQPSILMSLGTLK